MNMTGMQVHSTTGTGVPKEAFLSIKDVWDSEKLYYRDSSNSMSIYCPFKMSYIIYHEHNLDTKELFYRDRSTIRSISYPLKMPVMRKSSTTGKVEPPRFEMTWIQKSFTTRKGAPAGVYLVF